MSPSVIQWTTGNVGKEAVKGVLGRTRGLRTLSGARRSSPEKVVEGDVGLLCGLDPNGVFATDDVDALLKLRPDCAIYTPLPPGCRDDVSNPRSRGQYRHLGGSCDWLGPGARTPGTAASGGDARRVLRCSAPA
ncbi:MAG: hypothetical protein U5K56_04425 [Halioglobus sp.]|nr:hypothetical protein [Halioglobus sp.]